jgi:hypothetical protein
MKSVVMIAYAFPPEGNAGVYRPLRFARHLPSFGWQPTVITVETESYERYDPSLVNQIPNGIEVIRVRNRDPWQALQARRSRRIQEQRVSSEQTTHILGLQQNPTRSRARELARSIEAWVYHPDIAMGWIAPAARAVEQACKRVRADVIWATAGPVSSFHVAEKASCRTGIPYVLDFRDAWTITYNEFDERRPEWARRLDRRNMFRFLKGAQSVIFRYDSEAECYWRAYHGALDVSKIRIIPNGFEGDVELFTAVPGERCEVLYTGTLSDYRYDTLLQAIGLLKKSFPEEAARLHLHFIGEGTQAIAQQARELGLGDVITSEGALSQSAVTKRSKEAHGLLLLGRPPAMKGYELFAAAKLFGYLKAGQPILGVLPHDEAWQILQRLGVSTIADVESVVDIVAALRQFLRNWSNGCLRSLIPEANACRAFSAERQTQTLVSALEGTPAVEPFVPGHVKIPDSLREEISRRESLSKRKAMATLPRAENSFCRPANSSTAITARSNNNIN